MVKKISIVISMILAACLVTSCGSKPVTETVNETANSQQVSPAAEIIQTQEISTATEINPLLDELEKNYVDAAFSTNYDPGVMGYWNKSALVTEPFQDFSKDNCYYMGPTGIEFLRKDGKNVIASYEFYNDTSVIITPSDKDGIVNIIPIYDWSSMITDFFGKNDEGNLDDDIYNYIYEQCEKTGINGLQAVSGPETTGEGRLMVIIITDNNKRIPDLILTVNDFNDYACVNAKMYGDSGYTDTYLTGWDVSADFFDLGKAYVGLAKKALTEVSFTYNDYSVDANNEYTAKNLKYEGSLSIGADVYSYSDLEENTNGYGYNGSDYDDYENYNAGYYNDSDLGESAQTSYENYSMQRFEEYIGEGMYPGYRVLFNGSYGSGHFEVLDESGVVIASGEVIDDQREYMYRNYFRYSGWTNTGDSTEGFFSVWPEDGYASFMSIDDMNNAVLAP